MMTVKIIFLFQLLLASNFIWATEICQNIVIVDKKVRNSMAHDESNSKSSYIFEHGTFRHLTRFSSIYLNIPDPDDFCLDFFLQGYEDENALQRVLLDVVNFNLFEFTKKVVIETQLEVDVVKKLLPPKIFSGEFFLQRDSDSQRVRLDLKKDKHLCVGSMRDCHWTAKAATYSTRSYLPQKGLGFGLVLIQHLAHLKNQSFDITLANDRSWGRSLPNGTFTGVIGHMARREIDFAVSSFSYMEDRSKVVDFMAPFEVDKSYLISLRPGYKSPNLETFIDIFDGVSWSLICLSIAFGAMVVSWTGFVQNSSKTRLDVIKGFLNQSIKDNGRYKNGYGALFLPLWMLYAYVINLMYVTSLNSVIVAPNLIDSLESVDDVINKNGSILLKKGVSKIDLVISSFPDASKYLTLVNEASEIGPYLDNNQNATIYSWPFLLDKCPRKSKYHHSKEPALPNMAHNSWIVLRNAPWFEELSRYTLKTIEGGLYTRNSDKAYASTFKWDSCRTGSDSYQALPFNIQDMAIGFYVLFVGSSLSIVLFMLEIGCNHRPSLSLTLCRRLFAIT